MSVAQQELFALANDAKGLARLTLLNLFNRWRAAHDFTLLVARVKFADSYNGGAIAVDDELRDHFPQISAAALKKWSERFAAKGAAGLADQYGNRKGDALIDRQPELRECVLGFITEYPHASSTRCFEFVASRFRGTRVKVPCERKVRGWITEWKQQNVEIFTAVTNPDAWKNKHMLAFGSLSESIIRLNQRWELDCTPADLQLVDGRYVISGAIDVYSRRLTLLVTKSARSSANAEVLRKKMLAEGVPEEIKTDQGKDYLSHGFKTVAAALGIQQVVSNKFSPWEKGHVERSFETFSHDLLELLPGYSGHNVADAQALRASKSFAERLYAKNAVIDVKLTAEQLQQFCDDWCAHRYAHRKHEGDGMEGKTPFQKAAEWRQPIRRIEDERALDLLLAEVPQNKGLRMVQKKGLRLPEGWYIAPELEAFAGTNKQVHVRYLTDAGKVVVYDTEDWKFICIAVLPELVGISRKEIAAKADAIKERRISEERARIKAIRKSVKATDAAAEILADNIRTSGKLVQFPKLSEHHTTPALEAAAQARAELHPTARDSADLIDSGTFHEMRVQAEAAQLVATPRFESRAQRAFWLADQGYQRALTAEEHDYLAEYRRAYPRESKEMDELMTLRHGDDAAQM